MKTMREIIGTNIAKMREKQGLNQDNIASYLGLSRVQISHYERGKREISVTELNKLSDLFGVELSELLEEDLEIQNLNLAFAFRSENSVNDLEQIASFKKTVMNYLKMERINAL
jgi:transcriptional regulator with XRE-family HTH domain